MSVLTTERLILRRFDRGDAEFILVLLNEPSFLRNVGDKGVRTVADAEGYIASGPVASYERFGFGLYLVALRDSGTPIGMCGLLKRDTLDDVDIGFAFLPAYWSKGYAVESAAAIMTYGRDVLGLQRIVAIVSPDNRDSFRVLEKIGFTLQGMIRQSDEELAFFASDSTDRAGVSDRRPPAREAAGS